jgi:glutaconate CoA-transferase subunit A
MTTQLDTAVNAVRDGAKVFFGGFGYNQPFAIAHELIRREIDDLTIVRASGGILLDQLVGAGCVSEAVIAHCWNAIGPTPTHAFRRAVEDGEPAPLTVEEFGLGDLNLRLFAGARRLPFVPTTGVVGTGQFEHRMLDDEKFAEVTVDGERHHVMKPLRPEVGFVHVHRADTEGNAQLLGPKAEMKYGALACDHLVVTAEEIVDTETIQAAPEQTILPAFMVDDVVEVPGGSHPAGVLDHYPRDVAYLQHYGEVTADTDGFEAFLSEWVHGVESRAEYLEKLEASSFRKVPA